MKPSFVSSIMFLVGISLMWTGSSFPLDMDQEDKRTRQLVIVAGIFMWACSLLWPIIN
jgi:hypothetical protein